MTSALDGQLVSYIITITNHGPDNATGISLTDVLDYRLIYISDNASGVKVGQTLSWTGITINTNKSYIIQLVVRLNGTGNIGNIVNVTGSDQNNTGDNSSNGNNSTVDTNASINLTISKVVNVTSALDGQLVSYIITITNHGPDNATGISLTDVLDYRLIYISDNASGVKVGQTLSWTGITINTNKSYIIQLIVRLNGTGNIKNIVNVTGSDQNNTGDNSSNGNNSTVDTNASINLTISKVVNVTSALDGQLVSYIITITNHGPDNATGISLTDVLDYRLIYISDNASAVKVGQTLSWTGITINTNKSYIIQLIVRLNGTGNIKNIVNVTGSDQNNTGNNSSNGNNSTVDTNASINLTISKTVNVTNALDGQLVSYIITITNHGPDNATGISLTDVLDYRLIYISDNASAVKVGQTLSWTGITINTNKSYIIQLIVRLNGTGNIKNIVNVTGSDQNNTGDNSSNGNNSTVDTNASINLTISKTVDVTNALDGQLVSYIINVTNHGPDNATGVSLTDVLDYRLIYVSDNASGVKVGQTVSWIGITINVNGSYIIQLIVRLNGTGNIKNIVNVTGSDQNNTGDNSSEGNNSTINVNPTVNLNVTKTANTTNVLNGQEILFTITVTNNGPDNATNVNITEIFGPKLIYVNSSTNFGNYDETDHIWYIGSIANSSTVTLTLVFRVNGTGDISNNLLIYSSENNTGNNTINITINSSKAVNLSIIKTANISGIVYLNQKIAYTITVSNYGPDNATNINIADILPNQLQFVSANGTYHHNAGAVTWSIAEIANGDSYTIKLIVKVVGVGNIVNIANINSSNETNVGKNSSNSNDSNITGKPNNPFNANKTNTKLVAYSPKTNGKTVELVAKLTDVNGNLLKGKTIKFYIDGKYVGSAITNGNGIAKLVYHPSKPLSNGKHKILAIFTGDYKYNSSQGSNVTLVDESANGSSSGNGDNSHMKHTGVPLILIAILFLLLPLIRRKKDD
ncbi:hypothetical protein MBCUR_18570 [Methanobrevibacter curvatus]|uniref:Large cysteine-rich periplasmic protein OmcB n=1 Tax=Methanobrevibacter curvatus TaxID=49547 RepID=A0A166C076_9EURY|nr:hypothetical protein MBCUR_18570 [Methanobrevibacter curvatus]